VVVDGEITVKPHDVKYSPSAISNHWGLPVKPKRPKGHVVSDLFWNGHLDGAAVYLFAASPMAMSANKLIPGSLRQLPQRIGQGTLLFGITRLYGIGRNAMAKTESGRFSTSVGGRRRGRYMPASFLVGPLDFRRQYGS
jgi:hypothetical protein